jgi:hypothetical protein
MPRLSSHREAMASATRHVLCNYDLLELILLNLEMKDLYSAQQVCSFWDQLIRRSQGILRIRYMLPAAPNRRPFEDPPMKLNPLYTPLFNQQCCFYLLKELDDTVHFHGTDPWVIDHADAFARPEASWRKMLLFQPATKYGQIRATDPSGRATAWNNIHDPEYLKMDAFISFLQSRNDDFSSRLYTHMLSNGVTGDLFWLPVPSRTAPSKRHVRSNSIGRSFLASRLDL